MLVMLADITVRVGSFAHGTTSFVGASIPHPIEFISSLLLTMADRDVIGSPCVGYLKCDCKPYSKPYGIASVWYIYIYIYIYICAYQVCFVFYEQQCCLIMSYYTVFTHLLNWKNPRPHWGFELGTSRSIVQHFIQDTSGGWLIIYELMFVNRQIYSFLHTINNLSITFLLCRPVYR